MASLILSHCKEAIILSFIVAPILWFPTYFVFHINEKVDRHVPQYHVDANEDSFLFRSVKDSPRSNIIIIFITGGFGRDKRQIIVFNCSLTRSVNA